MSNRLDGKIAVITGGARGNGFAMAKGYAEEGAYIVIADVNLNGAKDAANKINDLGGKAQGVQVNVTDRENVREMIGKVVNEHGRIDILVNNAGVIGRHHVLEISEEEWDRVLDINLKGTFLCSQAAAEHMTEQKNGVIINITSVNGESLNPSTIHYCISKGGVNTLTKGFAQALAPEGIRVNAIGPCAVKTDLSADRLADPEAVDSLLSHIPMGRIAEPEDLVGAAKFLASEESTYVTGHVLYVDGGWLTM